ncbi:N-acetylmuramoyl-L-alanine amidase [Listeria newyorkensis]|uniref:N-acetylmuramoyl-L-alanine amidase n=1 Tax=Listeria newyorkensis TaxID=1497681 RepID=A0A841YZH5_9LIST|nr:N-acetylmuramoyl-L-alanine amidase [Listeria newyorkensis]MBC1458489.1 N-acetylmuramoyl-L-alanine amidase [Listeria newyorkensis]
MSVITNDYIRVNQYSRPGSKLTVVNKIIMHYTANNGGTARNHRNYFNTLSDRYASAHIFVDDIEALCIIPQNEVAYQANDVQKYVNGSPYRGVQALLSNANFKAIGVEMCLDKKGNITAATFNRTVDVVAELCKTHKLTVNDIVRHYDVTGKNCPAPWVKSPAEFTRFKNAVNLKLKGTVKKGKQWLYAKRNLYILQGAGDWNSKLAFTLPQHSAVQVDWDNLKNGWFEINYQGKKGYYSASVANYFDEKNPNVPYTCQSDLLFRADPKWGGKPSFRRKKGETINVVGKSANGWLKCTLGTQYGYLPNSEVYLKKK